MKLLCKHIFISYKYDKNYIYYKCNKCGKIKREIIR